jgi:predicted metal-dependent TIM-barrel fold hydrolase
MGRYIDSSTHSYLRSSEDIELMSLAGIVGVVVCPYFPVSPSGAATLIDLFKWVSEEEPERLSAHGMSMRATVGIHPRSIPESEVKKVLDHIFALFDNELVYGLGEVGLESKSKEEEHVFRQQLRIANEYPSPILVHTPKLNKPKILDLTLKILEDENVDYGKVIINHLTPDLVARVREKGALAGITVQPGKLAPKDVCDIVTANGPEGIVVNSNLGNIPSDPLTLPRVAHAMDSAGISGRDVELVTYSNIRKLFTM